MDYKNLKQAKWAFRFNQPLIKLWRIDPQTNQEEDMGDNWKKGMWGSYVWRLDNDKSWVSIKVKKDRIEFWVKSVNTEDKKIVHQYQIIVAKHDEQRVAIGDPDEMVRIGMNWTKKLLTT